MPIAITRPVRFEDEARSACWPVLCLGDALAPGTPVDVYVIGQKVRGIVVGHESSDLVVRRADPPLPLTLRMDHD